MTLAVDVQSDTWRLVREYARARIVELSYACTRINTEAQERDRIAARIHELETLMDAPKQRPIETGFSGETY